MYVLGEGNSLMRRLQARSITSSAISVALAIGTAIVVQIPVAMVYYLGAGFISGTVPFDQDVDVKVSLSEMLQSFVSPNLVEPFQTFSPFPILLLVILTTYAMCSAGEYFQSIKRVVDGCYVLFSGMLSAVMYTLPVFSFLAMLDGMLRSGPEETLFVSALVVFIPLSLIAMILFYIIRLAIAGVRPGPFMKKLGPLIKENLLFNSTIDAVPFNTRYCITKYGFDRKRTERYLPTLAQINLDGNCFVITLIAVLLMTTTGISVTWFDVIVVGLVVFFLSLGAPNQPGSILIGMLIILSYMDAMDILALAIVCEALFGRLQSITNAVGDIVTIAVTDQREKASGTDENSLS